MDDKDREYLIAVADALDGASRSVARALYVEARYISITDELATQISIKLRQIANKVQGGTSQA